jgi:hypothetical protein
MTLMLAFPGMLLKRKIFPNKKIYIYSARHHLNAIPPVRTFQQKVR